MTTKFTPGPWRINGIASTSVIGAKERGIAACGGYYNNFADPEKLSAENEANAHLIAASPMLYEALDHLLALVIGECPSLINNDHHFDMAMTALKAARGES